MPKDIGPIPCEDCKHRQVCKFVADCLYAHEKFFDWINDFRYIGNYDITSMLTVNGSFHCNHYSFDPEAKENQIES